MCGIGGGINLQSPQETLKIISQRLSHRGPDDQGIFIDHQVALAHRRLSIIDLQGGHQPMTSSDGRYVIVFNGEIYNFQDIRKELEAQGIFFYTSSDTEVLLAAYVHWGRTCLDRFIGVFAFAIWDKYEKTLWLVRDRVGKKPLYYIAGKNYFIFASQAKALWPFAQKLDARAIDQYLTFRYIPGERTFFQEIKKIPAGHWFLIDEKGQLKEKQRYWDLPLRDSASRVSAVDLRRWREEYQGLFEDAVKIRLFADVPVGIFLSSGIDSLSIAREMVKHCSLRTFTMGFHANFDEAHKVKEMNQTLGAQPTFVYLQASDFDFLPQAFAAMDEPYGDPIVLPTYLLAHEASKSVKVVLTGDGADELLGGYIHHRFFQMMPQALPRFCYNTAAWISSCLPQPLLERAFDYPLPMGVAGKKRLVDLFKGYPERVESYLAFATLLDDRERKALYTPQWQERLQEDPDELVPQMQQHFYDKKASFFDQVLRWDFKTWFVQQTLMKLDRLTMAHGLEARCPFADHRLIEFFFRLPLEALCKLGHNKNIFRQGCPKASSRKRAFCLSVDQSYKAAFERQQEQWLEHDTIDQNLIFQEDIMKRLINRRHQSPLLVDKKITAMMALNQWINYARK